MPETIVAAWCEYAAGPGWANQPLWYLVRDGDGRLRVECLQSEQQTREMITLYNVCAAAHASLLANVRKAMHKPANVRKAMHKPEGA